ncbi:MAG: hypothetical protein JNM28_01945 [Armatimonadetes bacterium]|nr:hypothetical protein [Armatimonadota bacterium]
MTPCAVLGIAIAATASSHPKPGRWWDGDPSKEIPAIKAPLQKAEGVQTPTGYEDKKVLMPLIKAALKENQSGGFDEARFIRLCALVYRGRHAPGIEADEYYKTAKSHVQLVLRSWEKKVDSYSFIRACMLFWYEFGYNGATPELDYIKKVRPYAKDDPVFDEGLVKFIGYRYQVFGKQDILNEARKLAKRSRAVYTNARISGFAIMTVAFFNKDKKLLD